MTYILELQIKWQTLSNYYINSFLQQHVQKVCFCTPLPKLGFTKFVDLFCPKGNKQKNDLLLFSLIFIELRVKLNVVSCLLVMDVYTSGKNLLFMSFA